MRRRTVRTVVDLGAGSAAAVKMPRDSICLYDSCLGLHQVVCSF